MARLGVAALLLWLLAASSAWAQKELLAESIESKADLYWRTARQIWQWAEPGYQEERSSALLQQLLTEEGFEVESGVAGMPTAFVASFGSGEPVIGILAEFDALPGLSQQASAERAPRSDTNWGHGCGHHLFGVGSVAAAVAVADALRAGDVQGTVRLYGTPAEEGGGAKVFMVRAGMFEDVDTVLHWHPGSENVAGDPSNMARIAAKFRYRGRSAHAAGAPEQGRSALDAVTVLNHAAELLREHTPDRTRIHHVITSGGEAPNVVPEFAEVYYYVRHPLAAVAQDVYRRLLLCAEAGALATETELEVEFLGGIYNLLPNDTLAAVTLRNLRRYNDIVFDDEEQRFAEKLQQSLLQPRPLKSVEQVRDASGEVSSGSTDVGDVSWVVPTTGLRAACWVPGTPAHSWQAVASGGTTIGQKGMMLAARALAGTAWDLLRQPELIAAAWEELRRRTADRGYEPMLEPGQQPPLHYRNAPSSN